MGKYNNLYYFIYKIVWFKNIFDINIYIYIIVIANIYFGSIDLYINKNY